MINVLVTAVGGRSVGFHVMRSLLLEPETFNVFVCDMNPNAAGLYYGPQSFVVPGCNKPDYVSKLNSIAIDNKIDIIIPGSEPELFKLSDLRDKVVTKLLINPKKVIDICKDKELQYAWLVKNGYEPPLSVKYEDIKFLIDKKGFPIVGKPTKSTGGSRSVKIIANWDELQDYIYDKDLYTTFFQEYVGSPYDEYTTAVIADNSGNIIDSIVMHRILEDISSLESRYIDSHLYQLSTGYSQVIVIKSGVHNNFCEKLCKNLGIKGPANIQYRLTYDEKKGPQFKVFEIHARFSGTAFMRASVGFNDSALLTKNFVTEEPIQKPIKYQKNVKLLKYFDHVITKDE